MYHIQLYLSVVEPPLKVLQPIPHSVVVCWVMFGKRMYRHLKPTFQCQISQLSVCYEYTYADWRTFVRMPVNKHIRTNVRSDKYPFPGHLSESDHMLLASILERKLADGII